MDMRVRQAGRQAEKETIIQTDTQAGRQAKRRQAG
jgi:hypothetical protein